LWKSSLKKIWTKAGSENKKICMIIDEPELDANNLTDIDRYLKKEFINDLYANGEID